jgi:shikimate kinase
VVLRGAVGAGKTCVARTIKDLRNDVKIVDVDDSKVRRYGTSERCNPDHDFPEAGRRARTLLDRGFHTFVIEAFAEKGYVDLCMKETGRKLSDTNVAIVWLSCALETSLKRKRGEIAEGVIRYQHKRYRRRYRPAGEIEIETDHVDADDVVRALLRVLPLSNQEQVSRPRKTAIDSVPL